MKDIIRTPLVRMNDAIGRAIGSKLKRVSYSRPATLKAKDLFGQEAVRVIEIGCAAGNNAVDIFRQLNVSEFVLIDPYESYADFKDYNKQLLVEMRREAERKLRPFASRIKWLRHTSQDAISNINGRFDFIYVDGNHAYDYALSDMINYHKLLSSKFVFGGHDIDLPDVAKAFVEFVSNNHFRNYEIKDPDWIIYSE